MKSITVIEASSMLGVGPTGVEELPSALRAAGLLDGLDVKEGGMVDVPPDSREHDPETLLLNPAGVRLVAKRLADLVARALQAGEFPLVLGGDCSIEIGNALALRRLGRYGLFFIDGHADFYQIDGDPDGEVSSMELALISGRGPSVLSDIDGLRPLVRDEDIVVFGFRDEEEAAEEGSPNVRETGMHVFSLSNIRSSEVAPATKKALAALARDELRGFWVHLDADVLDDAVMPAVDYRLPGGLSFQELTELLQMLIASGRAVGLSITIYNPRLDPDGSIAQAFVKSLRAGLAQLT